MTAITEPSTKSEPKPKPSKRKLQSIAEQLFGWTELRPGLLQAIDIVASGTDLLAVMPTGYGKSAIYKVAGAALGGITVVVSPLIALQADQIAGIEAAVHAPGAVAVNSGQTARANGEAWERLTDGSARYLFLAPEQFGNDETLRRLKALDVTLFVVDEAHCVSSWGHDFRPDYLRLGSVVGELGHPPTVALTATGSPPVRQEIVERLDLLQPQIITRGFDRPNIRLTVDRHEHDPSKRDTVLEQVAGLPKPGLLYVSTRNDTELYAEQLAAQGLRTAAYHAGLGDRKRRSLHAGFRTDEFDVVVATSAFGMGIDKAQIRFVVHAAIPESLDSYYQEVGRAGRNGEDAIAALHYRSEDLGLRTFFNSGVPKKKDLYRALVAIGNGAETLDALAEAIDLKSRRTAVLVNLLEEVEAVGTDGGLLTLVGDVDGEESAARAHAAAESRHRIEQSRISMMRAYAETLGCRRQFLLGYFGEDLEEPCGNCDTCDSAAGSRRETDDLARADSDGARTDEPFALQSTVRHIDWGNGTVMRIEDDRITVFFEEEGYKVLSLEAVEEHHLLVSASATHDPQEKSREGETVSDTIPDGGAFDDAEQTAALSQQTVSNDAVGGETVLQDPGDDNGEASGEATELEPILPENELAGEEMVGLDDEHTTA